MDSLFTVETGLILAGDVGATKVLLEVGEARGGKWFPKLARRYATSEAASFPDVLTAFLGEWNVVRELWRGGGRLSAWRWRHIAASWLSIPLGVARGTFRYCMVTARKAR